MKYILYISLLNIIPLSFYVLYITRKILKNYFILINFFSFLFFFFIILSINFIFFFSFSLFFFFNFWRFLKFFKKLGHVVYFKKLSIYFSFWQYIFVYIYKYIYNFIIYIFIYIYNKIIYIFNLYFLKILINNHLIFYFLKHQVYIFLNIYNYILVFKKLLYNLKFIEFFYYIYSCFPLKKKSLNYKYKEDPIIFRNEFFKIYNKVDNYIYSIIMSNYYIKSKNFFLFFLFYFLEKYIKIWLLHFFNIKGIIYILKYIYNDNFKIWILKSKKNIIIFFIYLYVIFLNSIYYIIFLNIYLLYNFFKFINFFLKKNSFYIKCIIIILFLFYFNWIINYFFILLYKHYLLYFPLFKIKETFHFLNFELIDLRNYFNIVKLHNVLIDLNIHNNLFYNEVIKNLNLKINHYNFKFSSNFNVNLYIDKNINKQDVNKEIIILNNIFEKWNKYHGANFIRRWRKYKRMLNWSLRYMFKGKDWYRAIKREKLKSSNLSIFNNGRYFENSKAEISNNMGFWENLHQVKRLPYNKEIKAQFQKTQAWYTYFKKRHTSKKRPRYFLSSYIKMKNIPFRYIYKEFDTFFLENYKIKEIKKINFYFESYLKKSKNIKKIIFLLKNLHVNIKLFKIKKSNNKFFFFKKFYRDFVDIQKNLVWKNKMPSLLITEMRMHRLPPISTSTKQYKDYISMSNADEMHQLVHYSDLAKKSCLKNIFFKARYIYTKYPYKLNNNGKYYQYAIKNYFNVLDTGIKIAKKFFFLERSKLRNFNKFSHRLLNKIDNIYGNQLLKYKYWDRVFFLKRLNKNKLDFWSFFDYLKTNKYKLASNNNYFTVFFLDRWKKDYYHMRIYLLRIISFLHYYTNYKKIKMSSNFKFFNLMKDIKIEGAPISLESLSTLNSLKYLNSENKVNENIMEQVPEQEQINEVLFHHFKLRWHFRELLNPSGVDSYGNREKFMFLINLFFKKFNKYFIEYRKINEYNNKYKYKVKSYKIKVLRKIRNLKNFFFFNTKRNKGYRLFSFLNTFSIDYHWKHLLWHSPYSFLLFKKNNILENIKIIDYYNYYYNYNKIKYEIKYYSFIFNLLLNIIDIKEDWAFYLTDDTIYIINYNILNMTFYYVFNYGNFYFFYLNELDIFRIFNSLLKNYYNNFLIKLIRYRYILEKNNYKSINFIIHYIKQWYKSSYIKIRYFIYQTHETYVKYLKRKYFHFLKKEYWIKNRVDFLSFWFIFDYYIKCLIKYLFNKYFIKQHFIFWWLQYRLNFSFFFFFWLRIQEYKYINLIYWNNFFFKIFLIIIYKVKLLNQYILNLIYIDLIIFFWYVKIIFNNFIFYNCIEYNIVIIKFLYKLILFDYYFNIKKNTIIFFNLIINIKKIQIFKFNIQEFLYYINKYIQNIKNRIIFFKSNYYFFKKQKLIRKRKRDVPLYSFLSTNLKRNWFFLKNRTTNFYAFHNIYLLNIKYSYIIKEKINMYNFFFLTLNMIPFLKKQLFNSTLFVYLLYIFYIFFFLLIWFINKKYFKIFFINKSYYILNIDLYVKKKKNENTFDTFFKLNKRNLYIYKFLLFNSSKDLNLINIFKKKKYLWFKFLINLKKKLNYTSFDQFYHNKPIYKSNLFIINFIKIDNLNNYIKNYMKFFSLKKIPFIKIFNDFLIFYQFNVEREKINFDYQNFTDYINFNFIFFYWIFLVPYFFLQYLLIKYHLKFYIKTKRRISYLIRACLDNIRLFVKINKYIGRSFFKSIYKSKRWKDPSHVFLNKKRPKKSHFSTNYLRFRKLYYRLSPIGSYYYWFSKINIIQYLFSYKNFFFKSIIKSYYYIWFILIYIVTLIFLISKYNVFTYINKFKFIYIKKSN